MRKKIYIFIEIIIKRRRASRDAGVDATRRSRGAHAVAEVADGQWQAHPRQHGAEYPSVAGVQVGER